MVKKLIIFLLTMAVFVGSFNIGNGQESLMSKIVINIPSRTLTYYDGTSSKTYPVAVGKASTKTPTGNFSIQNKIVNPYYSKLKIPGGRVDNPLGIRWMGFKGNYGIHGNSAPNSIGTTASGGCVRMFNYDVKELYEKVAYKTPVEVTYNLFQKFQQEKTKEKMLMIYPDVYKKEKNLTDAVKRQLDAGGLASERTLSKINGAASVAKDRLWVIGEKWVFIANQQYVSTEIIKEGNEFYIGEEVLRDYYGLVLNKAVEGLLTIQDYPMAYKIIDDKYYVSVKSIQQIIGGSFTFNDSIENLWYDVSFVKLNGVFLEKNHGKIETHRPMIPVQKLSDIVLPREAKGTNIKVIENVEHMELEEAQRLFGFQYDMRSIEKKVELFIQPTIEFEASSQMSKEIYDSVMNGLKDIGFQKDSPSEDVITMEYIGEQYEVIWNPYKTKLLLKLKEKLTTENINENENEMDNMIRKK